MFHPGPVSEMAGVLVCARARADAGGNTHTHVFTYFGFGFGKLLISSGNLVPFLASVLDIINIEGVTISRTVPKLKRNKCELPLYRVTFYDRIPFLNYIEI